MISNRQAKLFITTSLLIQLVSTSFLDYIIPRTNEIPSNFNEVDTLPSVPYELSTTDEKFLQEAAKLIGAVQSELDLCHHRVILQLRKTCHDLNADQLGKLSVMLLNCQSHTEGRKLFECTENMNLKDCTKDMDSDTWNAYHLITNRAKAVCVAIRQEQFRGLAEITVNKLMNSAHDQISMMERLSENQEKMQDLTNAAIEEFSDKNEKLIEQQNQMLKVSDAHRSTMESNLHELMQEKSLIRSGQKEVAEMMANLKHKLDESITNYKQQTKETTKNHEALTKDLKDIHENAVQISRKITETTEYMLSQNEITGNQLDQTINQLDQLQQTVLRLTSLLHTIETDVDQKLSWILDKVGGTDALVNNVRLLLTHFGYLLLGMLFLVFVNAPAFYRIVFISTVPVNFACTILRTWHLDLVTLTGVLLTIYAANLIRTFLWATDLKSLFALKTEAIKKHIEPEKRQVEEEVEDYENTEVDRNFNKTSKTITSIHKLRRNYTTLDHIIGHDRSMTPIRSDMDDSDHSRSVTPFTSLLNNRIRCTALTLKGGQCRHAAAHNSLYCRLHEK